MIARLALLLALALPMAWADALPAPATASSSLSVQAPPALLKKLAIAPIAETRFAETLRLPGRVALDEHRVARIGPSVSGRVTDVKAFIGQGVRKGDTLALINSTELGSAQAAYLKAKTQAALQRLTVERAQRLFAEGIISQATLHERESALAEDEVEVRADEDQLAVLGMSPAAIQRLAETGHIASITQVAATQDGTVIERQISVGQIAQPSDDLFTVADLSRVWVVAETPEREAHKLAPGRPAEVDIPALPRERITGKVIYVADIVNPATRTVTVRMEVENARRKIKPEMLAEMVIRQPEETGLAVPAQAVVRIGEIDHVFVQVAPDRFELRPVALGPEQEGRRWVAEGVSLGQPIVVEGAFHLNNERIRKELE